MEKESSLRGSDRYHLKIFIDFWNFQLACNEVDSSFLIDWRKLPLFFVDQAKTLTGLDCVYKGMNVYGSYGPNDSNLRKWVNSFLQCGPGVDTCFTERPRKWQGPQCPECHSVIERCPKCDADMKGYEEKGVDVKIVTDLIKFAWEDAYDIAIVGTSDKDAIPAIEFLKNKDKIILHAAFPFNGMEVSKACWASFDMVKLKENYRRENRH